MPSQRQKGLDSHAEADPVSAKTIKIMASSKLVAIPQRCFSLFILFIMITNIVTLSDGDKTKKVLIVGVLKIDHIIINQIIDFIAIINVGVIINGHFI